MARKTFTVDIQSILDATNYLDRVPIEVVPRLSYELRELAQRVLFRTFLNAMPYANSQGGFPAPFQEHVLSAVARLPVLSIVSGSLIQIVVDFDQLGDSDDLSRAYHQGARLADGGYLWGPYEGQPLKSENALARYAVWNVVYSGYSEFKFGRKSKIYRLPEWASWENTMNQRIAIWGDKAPEWLYIQMGQQGYSPKIPAGSVFEDFEAAFYAEGRALFQTELNKIMARVNEFRARGIPATITPGGRVRVTKGQFAGSLPQYKYD